MNDETTLPLPTITRVEDPDGRSRIEPAFDPSWAETERLAWWAAVTALDTGLRIQVQESAYQEKRLGKWRTVPGHYSLRVGSGSLGPLDYRQAHSVLNGISLGAARQKPAGARLDEQLKDALWGAIAMQESAFFVDQHDRVCRIVAEELRVRVEPRQIAIDKVTAELHRLAALPTVQADDGHMDRWSVGARWAIRMVREVIDGTRDPNEPTLSGQEFITGLLRTLDSPVDDEVSDG